MANCLRVLGLGLLFLGWNAPNHYPPWPAFHLELFCALGVCLLGTTAFTEPLLAGLARRSPAAPGPKGQIVRLPLSLSARIWLLAALWPILQFLAGGLVFGGDALIGLLYGLGVVMSLYVGHLWAARQGAPRVLGALWLTLVVGALAANGLAMMQWLRLGVPGWWAMELIDHRPFANLAQPNHFGLLMVMAIIAVTALFESGAVQRRWVLGLAVAFFALGVLISQSRASVLALATLAALWLLTRRRVPTRLRLSDLAAAVLLWLALSLALEPLQQLLFLSPSSAVAVASDGEPRRWIWLHYWAAIQERPWAGYGFNQGVAAMAAVAAQVHPSRNVIYAHNMVLDLMAWVGIPLALTMVGALFVWMLSWLRKVPDPLLMAQRHGVFAIWLVLVTQSMLEFPYAHTYFVLPAALLAGAITAQPQRVVANAVGAIPRASRWVMALAAGTALLLGVTTWEYFGVESDFRLLRFERANFGGTVEHEPIRQPWVLDQLAALNASARIQIRPGMSAQELEKLAVLARRFHILSTRLDYAKALALNGKLAQAQTELQIIRSVHHPLTFGPIERRWQEWLQANAADISHQ